MKNINELIERRWAYIKNYGFNDAMPKRVLYNHLPKCGGSSLNHYLKKHYKRKFIYEMNSPDPSVDVREFKNFSEEKRYSYNLLIGHLTHFLIPDFHKESLKITVLRDPIDRIISHYYYAKGRKSHYLHQRIIDNNISLQDYVELEDNFEVRNYYIHQFAKLNLHDKKMDDVTAFEKALENIKNQYDLVGILEHYNVFTTKLTEMSDFKFSYKKNDINKTKSRPKLEDISHDTLKVIEEINELDIKFYDKMKSLFL